MDILKSLIRFFFLDMSLNTLFKNLHPLLNESMVLGKDFKIGMYFRTIISLRHGDVYSNCHVYEVREGPNMNFVAFKFEKSTDPYCEKNFITSFASGTKFLVGYP